MDELTMACQAKEIKKLRDALVGVLDLQEMAHTFMVQGTTTQGIIGRRRGISNGTLSNGKLLCKVLDRVHEVLKTT